MVLIDAAKGCVTQPPDLSRYPADFVVISFYKVHIHLILDSFKFCLNASLFIFIICITIFVKLFGYPTGLGALIVQNGK